LDEYIVMPNHVHGILIIDKMDGNGIVETPKLGVCTGNNNDDMVETPKLGVCTGNDDNDGIIADGIAIPATAAASEKWKSATLGVIMNQYKRICTIESRKINRYFVWQSRFHDHIIRDAGDLERIRNYIINNPKNWKEDKFNS
jgi:REP element-mobilizing transposase RayT